MKFKWSAEMKVQHKLNEKRLRLNEKKTKKNSERELYKREKQINLNQLSAS